ncbi:hypothetical protein [Streptomyces sp. NPDC053560]|uniref:hypothetical protein n=1 Tax=Streptomyces sp. NPDC053560 TaxID=3365711 RepID=UPI0037D317C9
MPFSPRTTNSPSTPLTAASVTQRPAQQPTQRRPDRAPTRPPNKPAHRREQVH